VRSGPTVGYVQGLMFRSGPTVGYVQGLMFRSGPTVGYVQGLMFRVGVGLSAGRLSSSDDKHLGC